MASRAEFRVNLNWLVRERLHHQILKESQETLQRRPDDAQLHFWKCFAAGMSGRASEAIRDLTDLRARRETEFAATVALLFFHKQQKRVDKDEVEALATLAATIQDSASDSSVVLAAHFCALAGDSEKCQTLLSRIVGPFLAGEQGASHQRTALQVQACAVFGWNAVLAFEASGERSWEGLDLAQKLLDHPSVERDVEAILSRACCHLLRNEPDRALEDLNHAIALQPSLQPTLVEKAKIMALHGDWDQAVDAAQRALTHDAENLTALKLCALEHAVRGAPAASRIDELQHLSAVVGKREPENSEEHFAVAQLFARFAARDPRQLDVTIAMLERALRVDSGRGSVLTELGFQLMIRGRHEEAIGTFRRAAGVDETNLDALFGVIQCQILMGDVEDAEQQLEFLKAIHDTNGVSPRITFLDALLAWRKDRNADEHARLLSKCMNAHLAMAQGPAAQQNVFATFTAFNADFILDVAGELLQHAPSTAAGAVSFSTLAAVRKPGVVAVFGSAVASVHGDTFAAIPAPVRLALDVLDRLVRRVPGALQGHLLTARAYFATGRLEKAQRAVNLCLSLDSTHGAAHVLSAEIALAQGNAEVASLALEQALSHDFSIRASCPYMLVKARVFNLQGAPDQALDLLQEALQVPGVRRVDGSAVDIGDRVRVFVDLAGTLGALRRFGEAWTLLHEAEDLFRDTSVAVEVMFAKSELAVQHKETEKALQILTKKIILDNAVQPGSPTFLRAYAAKANIYLTQRHDRRAFVQCYEDLAHELRDDPAAFVHLGDALMRIQAPEAAVGAFERALRLDPRNSALTTRIGRALISTHDYRRAEAHYKTALATNSDQAELRLDLARLQLKLRHLDDAEDVLAPLVAPVEDAGERPSFANGGGSSMIDNMVERVAALRLLVDIKREAGAVDSARSALEQARVEQQRVLEAMRLNVQGPEFLEQQRRTMGDLCVALGRLAEDARNDDAAAQQYRAALTTDATNEESMVLLARLHLRRHEHDLCRRQCETILRLNSDNVDAATLLADLSFREGRDDDATARYETLMRNRPTHYPALRKLITLLKRAGRLDDVPVHLQRAERADPRAFAHAGLNLCRGLYCRARNDVHEAIRCFNFARRDGEWGLEALANMIELYLNPENDTMWGNDGDVSEGHEEALRTAESLLNELKAMAPSPLPARYRVLEGFVLLGHHQASAKRLEPERRKEHLDRAEQTFIEILEHDRDNVPAMLGLSTVFMVEDSHNKARNMLKRIAKMDFNHELGEEFERSYLYLADIYIERNKYDLAVELCRRALQHNKSCGKAWEYIGIVQEKELSYRDAAEAYEQAWKCTSEASASVGFRLAFNCTPLLPSSSKISQKREGGPECAVLLHDFSRSSIYPV